MFNKIKRLFKTQKTAGKFITSGLFLAAIQIIAGFVVLRWIIPEELGKWQSFTIFVGYIHILTLGITSGLNRDLPYYLGKGDTDTAMLKLKAGGYYIKTLSVSLMLLIALIGFILYIFDVFSTESAIMFIAAFTVAALSLQTSFLSATFRSSHSFDRLTIIQLLNAGLYILLIPLVYFFNIWGYIIYQIVLVLFLFIGQYLYRPYKVKYSYNSKEIIELIKVGFPMYFWNYLSSISRSIPRLTLVVLGSPLLVGLYSPAGSVNAAMLKLPSYTNQYLFPQMSYRYGKSNNRKEVFNYARKAALILFVIMFFAATILALIIPPAFSFFFPKYIEGIKAAQITVFSGVFYSINAIFHNTLNSMKLFRSFKYIVTLKIIYIVLFIFIAFMFTDNILISVALGSLLAEIFNSINYYYFLSRLCKKQV